MNCSCASPLHVYSWDNSWLNLPIKNNSPILSRIAQKWENLTLVHTLPGLGAVSSWPSQFCSQFLLLLIICFSVIYEIWTSKLSQFLCNINVKFKILMRLFFRYDGPPSFIFGECFLLVVLASYLVKQKELWKKQK